MVVTLRPAIAESWVTQDRTAFPSKCTVQAPHNAMPQPNLVPLRPATSRSAHSKGMVGSASSVADLPLRTKVVDMIDSAEEGLILPPDSSSLPNIRFTDYQSLEHNARKVKRHRPVR